MSKASKAFAALSSQQKAVGAARLLSSMLSGEMSRAIEQVEAEKKPKRPKKPAPVYTADPGPWSFTIEGEPVGKGRPRASVRGGKIRMHTPEETRRYEQAVAMVAAIWMPKQMIDDDLEVTLEFVVRRPAYLKPTDRDVPASNLTDCDNYIKAGIDALKRHFRDHRVVRIVASKRYANPMERPCTRVMVERYSR